MEPDDEDIIEYKITGTVHDIDNVNAYLTDTNTIITYKYNKNEY